MSFKSQISDFEFRVLNFDFRFLNAKSFLIFTFYFLIFTSACSIPNLEEPECTEARQTIKEFYSFHFGSEMKPSKENLQKREKFLSDELKRDLAAQIETTADYFTATDDYPKAFRTGECQAIDDNKTVFQIVFFWKDDVRNEQREIKVEAIRENGKWLINRIF